MQRRLWGLGLAVTALASTVVTTAHAATEAPVTMTVGLMQDLDSPNPTVGVLVAYY